MGASDETEQTAAIRARLVTVLGAIASSIGVVGFVAVVGGMVVWIRFDSLHLPADTVVASIPRTSLIVIGLYTLIPFIGLGLLAVLLAFLFAADNLVPSHPWRNVGSAWSRSAPPASSGPAPAALAVTATSSEQPETHPFEAELNSIVQQAGELQTDAASAADFGRTKVVKQRQEQLQSLQQQLTGLSTRIDSEADNNAVKEQAARAATVLEQARIQIAAATTTAGKRRGVVLLTWTLTIFGLALIELCIVFLVGAPSYFQDVMLFVFGAVLALITLFVGLRTHGFTVFGVAIFVSILLFGTGTTLLRTYHVPKVEAAAVLRSGHDAGLTGYFVAETSESVYLVRVSDTKSGAGFTPTFPRFVVVPRTNIVAIEVGPLEPPEQAYGTSYRELRELCGQKVLETPAPKGPPECGQQPGLVTVSNHPGKVKARHKPKGSRRGKRKTKHQLEPLRPKP